MNNRLVIISIDSLRSKDIDFLKKLPNFSRILGNCAFVENIREIYPTLTYPIHTTMITGVSPAVHGVTNNQRPRLHSKNLDLSRVKNDWVRDYSEIKVKTVLDAAREKGLSTSAFLWPVTVGSKHGVNLPELWPIGGEDARKIYRDGASADIFESYFDEIISHYDWNNTQNMHVYGMEIALKSLRENMSDLTLIHAVLLDHIRHRFGVDGFMPEYTLREMDVLMGRIIDAVKANGCFDSTNFIILGDHGQIDIEQVFFINKVFCDMGIIRKGKDGKLSEYDAYGLSSGLSAQILMKENADRETVQKVYKALLTIKQKYPQAVERIFTREELRQNEGMASDNLYFMVEGTYGTSFSSRIGENDVEIPHGNSHGDRAKHGYHPDKGHKPPLIAFGPDIKSGVRIKTATMYDICPTICTLADLWLPQEQEGRCLEIIKHRLKDIYFFSDVDGTLGSHITGIPPKNEDAIRKFTDLGGHFAFATGRWHTSLAEFAGHLPINTSCIVGNGTAVYNFATQATEYSAYLPHHASEYMKDLLQRYPGFNVSVVTADGYSYYGKEEDVLKKLDGQKPRGAIRGENLPESGILKFVLIHTDPTVWEQETKDALSYIKSCDTHGVRFVSSDINFVEILPETVSKATALKRFCDMYGVHRKNLMAMGDFYNDLEMLKVASLSGSFEMSPDEVKKQASFIAQSCESGGLAEFLEKIIAECYFKDNVKR